MHRNTLTLVIFLAMLAGFVVYANIRRMTAPPSQTPDTGINPAIITTTPVVISAASGIPYTDQKCGISLIFPRSHTQIKDERGNVQFIIIDQPTETVTLSCQKNITLPDVSAENISDYQIGTVSAKIYREIKLTESNPGDNLIFRHPGKNIDIKIHGAGTAFDSIISSIKIL